MISGEVKMKHAASHTILPGYVPRSTSFDGRFGRIFGKLPPWAPPGRTEEDRIAAIDAYVAKMIADGEARPGNANIPAGYTYFGQFIDHDITFDPSSSLTRQNDPEGLTNFRTPRLDLDSLYGRGPDDQPYLYQPGKPGFLLEGKGINGTEPDLPRLRPSQSVIDEAFKLGPDGKVEIQKDVPAVALIGDPRNDENIIVSQLQLTFIRLHNRVLEQVITIDDTEGVERSRTAQFHEAQRIVRWFYQYVVWNDFVRRIVPAEVFALALKDAGTGAGLELGLKAIYNWKVNPYIPVEFSVAAYRLGHSLIRNGYQINFPLQGNVGAEFEVPIFDPTGGGGHELHGGRLLPHQHSIEWEWYFDIASRPGFPQLSEALDTHLSRSVSRIPGPDPQPLARLNILRGWRFNLPSGTDVAQAMGWTPIHPDDEIENSLWVYILKEAELYSENGEPGGSRLGKVGGTIVAAVFAGLLKGDPLSFVEQFPNWTPDKERALAALGRRPLNAGEADLGRYDIRDLLVMAGMPASAADVGRFIQGNFP